MVKKSLIFYCVQASFQEKAAFPGKKSPDDGLVCSKGKQWFPSFHVDNWMGDLLVITGTLVLGDSGRRSVHP